MAEQVNAVIRGVRISEQKARLVADMVRGKPAGVAVNILTFCPNKAAGLIKKLLESAIANAEQNNGLDVDSLVVARIFVERGAKLKRFSARAKGKGDRIHKPSSNFYLALEA